MSTCLEYYAQLLRKTRRKQEATVMEERVRAIGAPAAGRSLPEGDYLGPTNSK